MAAAGVAGSARPKEREVELQRVERLDPHAHTEFQRSHQSRQELAVDVAEAQIRFFRREKVPVLSMVWDLYGDRDAPVWSTCPLEFAVGSVSAYTRVNLRGMAWRALLADGPAALRSLVALTCDGATPEAVKAARDAIADLCDAYGIALTPERDAWVQAAELRQLYELRAHLKRERAWPDTLPG